MGWQDQATPVEDAPKQSSWQDSATPVEEKPSWQASATPVDHPVLDLVHPSADQTQQFKLQDTSPQGYLSQIPKLSPGSAIPYDPNAQPTKMPSAEETQKLSDLQGAMGLPTELVTSNPLMWAGRAVAGLMDRAKGAVQAAQKSSLPDLPQNVVNGFLSPDLFQAVRKQDALEGGNNLASTVESVFHEVVPPFFASNIFRPSLDAALDANKVKSGDLPSWIPGKTAVADATNALNSITKVSIGLGMDFFSDPLTHTILGGLTNDGRAALAERAFTGLGDSGSVADKLLNVEPTLKNTAFAEKVASGEAAMVQLQIPFSKNTIPILRLPGVAKTLENMAAKSESSVLGQFYRSVSMRTGLDAADALNNAYKIEEAGARLKVKEFMDQMPDQVDNKFNEYILKTAQFGDEDGLKVLRKNGLNYTPDEIAYGTDLRNKLSDFQSQYVAHAQNAGIDVSSFQGALSDEDKIQAIQEARKKGFNVPSHMAYNADGVDAMFNPQRGFRRMLSDEAAASLKELKEASGQFEKGSFQGGFSSDVDSQLKRSKFSDDVMNEIYGQKLGMAKPFRNDVINMVSEDAEETYRAARNARFVAAMKKQYGKTIPEWMDSIQMAKNNIAVNDYSAEDLKIANMDPRTLTKLQGSAWNDIQTRLTKSNSVADEPMKLLFSQQDLHYPAFVAGSIENMLSQPTQGRAAAVAAFLRDTLKKNMLTSMIRLPMHTIDGLGTSVFGLGTKPKYILQEMGSVFGKGQDELSKIMDGAGISETIFGDPKIIPKVTVTPDMLDDKSLNYFQNTLSDLIHSKASQKLGVKGFFDDMLEIGKQRNDVGKWLDASGRVARVPFDVFNDNPFSEGLRAMGGGATSVFTRARVRDLVDQGFSVPEAISRATFDLLDYRGRVNQTVGTASFFSPFLNYQLKNTERTVAVLMQKPGMWNMLNPYDGALQRNIQNFGQNGSPRQIALLRSQLGNLQDDTMISGFFGGADAIAKNGDWARGYVNDVLRNTLTPKELEQYQGSPWLGLSRIPTNLTALTEFASPLKWDAENSAPLLKAWMALKGIDPYTGQSQKFKGMPDDWFARSINAINQVNPFRAPKLYDAIAETMDRAAPQIRENLQNGGLDPKAAELFYNMFGSKTAGGDLKLSDEVTKQLTKASTFDVLRLTKADVQLEFQQKALIKERGAIMHQAFNDAIHKGQVYRLQWLQDSGLPAINKQINDNASAYEDYKFRLQHLQKMVGGDHPVFQDPKIDYQGAIQ